MGAGGIPCPYGVSCPSAETVHHYVTTIDLYRLEEMGVNLLTAGMIGEADVLSKEEVKVFAEWLEERAHPPPPPPPTRADDLTEAFIKVRICIIKG